MRPIIYLSRVTAAQVMLGLLTLSGYGGDATISISLTSQQVAPGSQAYVTVMLSNSAEVHVSELQQWIEFPKDKLSFVSARMGIAGDMAGAELKVDVQDRSQPEQRDEKGPGKTDIGIIHLSLAGKRQIPEGPVAEITFRVPSTLEEQTITLDHKAEAVMEGGQQLSDLIFDKGEVKVSRDKPARPGSGGHGHQM